MGEIIGEQPLAGKMTFRRDHFRHKWVLYGHCINNQTTFFYIGVCRLVDLYNFDNAYRNTLWRQTVKEDTLVTVSVLASTDSEIDAHNALRRMYDEARPPANVSGYQLSRQTVVTCIAGDNINKTYASATEAALQNGISAGALSNHLNGRRGYDNIRGMKFKRGLA